MMRRFSRRRDGSLDVTLEPAELELVRDLPAQLRALYDGASDDPARERLFPRAYLDPTEEQAEQEWQELVHPGLLAGRLDALTRLAATLEGAQPARRDRVVVHLEPDDVNAWLSVLNDARLALGARLGVTDEVDLGEVGPDDPNAAVIAAYTWLTYLEGELVETLLGDVPK
ncbi:MAG TPA: DUF2017 family protein [Acidimicrobiia bacterium]|jgi:hypothetical protein|nr:DUF2017 family protein [Acidimicrobiia bacterium]HEV3451938.1 DUF2017 family protein [Acidimicrobiia bacterium]